MIGNASISGVVGESFAIHIVMDAGSVTLIDCIVGFPTRSLVFALPLALRLSILRFGYAPIAFLWVWFFAAGVRPIEIVIPGAQIVR